MRNGAKIYHGKTVKSGNIIEISNFKESVLYGFTNNPTGRKTKATEEDSEKHRAETLRNAKRSIKRLINANYETGSSRLLTLTYRENVQDIDRAYTDFRKFVRAYSKHLGHTIKYVAIPELQDGSRRKDKEGRNAIHFHVVLFGIPEMVNLEYMRKHLWIHGSVNVKRLKDCKNVGAYLTMYLDLNSDKFVGRKIYLRSHGLKTPLEEKNSNPVDIAQYLEQGYHLDYTNTFVNDTNTIEYTILSKEL